MPGIPYRSALAPFADFIRKQRIGRKTWREIAEQITAQGVSCSPQAVHAFFKRYKSRGHWLPLGIEQIKPQIEPVKPVIKVNGHQHGVNGHRPEVKAGWDFGGDKDWWKTIGKQPRDYIR